MSKFATTAKPAVFSPVRSAEQVADTVTAEGGAGFTREPKAELFLLAITNMVGESTFYESAGDRDARFEQLVHQVTKEDPDWIARFIPYLRGTMNMRSASVVMAAEYVRAGGPNGRAVVASSCMRADEPAELVGYWISRYGKALPAPLKRGIADAAVRLYDERAALKYDGDKAIRMGDVLELTHPKPAADWQVALFHYLIDKRHNRDVLDTSMLATIAGRQALEAIPAEERRGRLGTEGLPDGTTWEWASSWVGGKLDASFWEAMIPRMGYMALLRNLRNFDEAGISPAAQDVVAAKLADAGEVAKSHQLPLRFASAFRAVQSVRWHWPLEQAIGMSLGNVPELSGRTLIMVDDSGSMDSKLSDRSDVTRRQAASVFAAALALRANDPTLIAFAESAVKLEVPRGGSILPLSGAIAVATNGGTRTIDILASTYDRHDRVIILTDEQAFSPDGLTYTGAFGGYSEHPVDISGILAHVKCPIYTFALAGYKAGHLPAGSNRRHTFGGLTDAGFTAIELLETGHNADWPF